MVILSAAAAFAVLMIVFSTAVTGITESYLRITSVRSKSLAQSVLKFLQEDPTIRRFAKDSIDSFTTNLLNDALNKLKAGTLPNRTDEITLQALAATKQTDIAALTEEWAVEAEKEAKAARAKADKAKGKRGVAKLVKEAEEAEKAAENARAAAEKNKERAEELKEKPDAKVAEESEAKAATITEDNQIDAAFEALTINHSLGESFNWMHRVAQGVRKILPGPTKNLKRVERLSTFSFLQRLAKTEIGMEIAKKGEDAALRALTMGFERYVAASNEVFRRHAQSATMILSFAFALFLNINAIAVFQHLVDNPQFSQGLIEEAEERNAQSEAALEKFNLAMANLNDDTAQTDGQASSPEDVEVILKQAQADFEAQVEEIKSVTSDYDLPIGWDQAHPFKSHCAFDEGTDCSFNKFFTSISDGVGTFFTAPADLIPSRATFEWVFGVALAGFLIGLGGPFWYRVFASLSNLLQVLRSIKGEPRREAIEPNKSSQQPASQELVEAVLRTENTEEDDQKLMKIFRASTGLSLDQFDDLPTSKAGA